MTAEHHSPRKRADPGGEDAHWREKFQALPYVKAGTQYEEFRPAFQYGWESRMHYTGKNFEDVESDLSLGWDRVRGNSNLSWEQARPATRDAWHRIAFD